MPIEFPNDPLPLNSEFYIERPPVEELAYAELAKPGSVIRLKAPRKMGKSSLMLRLIARATAWGYRTVTVDFQKTDEVFFVNLDKFLRWFCTDVSRQLRLEPRLDEYWDEDIGSKISCTVYFQGYLLDQLNCPLVLILKEVNRVFEHPNIAKELLPLLRSWHEEAKQGEILQNLRLVVIHSTEVYVSLNTNQSPFNVGLPLQLPEFTLAQVQELARRYGLDWADGQEAKKLMAMVGGHPYLVNLALYHLVNPPLQPEKQWDSLEQLLQEAPTTAGIYSHHLRGQLVTLRENLELADAMKQVVTASGSVRLEAIAAYKLESIGLVKLNGSEGTPSCELYRLYFKEQLWQVPSLSDRLKQLEQENQNLQRLYTLDELTQLGNCRFFKQNLEQMWQRLAREGTPLSLILCDIDYFEYYNDNYGDRAGDACLQQVAQVIRSAVSSATDVIARYRNEEFAVLLPHQDVKSAAELAERIRVQVKRLAIPFKSSTIGGLPAAVVTLSLGVTSTIPNSESDPALLVHEANKALYHSQKWGHNRVTIYDTLTKYSKNFIS
ncbi:MAG TPA: diguanylate cyclase [Cyanobacteria bacterium UBA8803]|nr:diguanylate cyclase [Cyanobacteria bacterium UBA9273]HBL62311.1 diguanylate cyclase [Cyanobacteria bacterium UBA8803]